MEELGAGLIIVLILFFALLPIISLWVIFQKAGRPGWAAIVPIYNILTMVRVAQKPDWWVIMFFIPYVNWVFQILTCVGMCKAFRKDTGFIIGAVLLPGIFWPILAFGSSVYDPE
ncbi:MAG: DUF5684 domain-containing protein [Rikenellaceae bacterium]